MMRLVCSMLISGLLVSSVFAQSVTKLYVPSGTGRNVTTIIGLESQSVINQLTSAFDIGIAATNADSSEIWLFGEHSTYCHVINSITDRTIRTIDITLSAEDVAFTPDGKYCFVVGTSPDKPFRTVMAVDCNAKEALYSVGGFSDPSAVVVSSDSRFLYATSFTEGRVVKIAIPSFQIVKTFDVGPEPVDLTLSADGNLLLVACQGLGGGSRGGSQITVINTQADKLHWIFNDVGRGPNSVTLTPDQRRLVVTYAEPQSRPQINVRIFHALLGGDRLELTPGGGFLHGNKPSNGMILGGGTTWIASDKTAGPAIVNLEEEIVRVVPPSLVNSLPLQIASVRVDVEARIQTLQATMATNPDPTTLADSYLDLAYLYATAGRKNDLVATYNKVITAHPQSLAAITAGARMADLTYEDNLFGQTAEYSMKALEHYSDYLVNSTDKRQPDPRDVLTALDRLAVFAKEYKRDYLNKIADTFLKISARNAILAELYFRLGYHLELQGDSRTAKRCFTESEAQIVTVQDRMAMLSLSARLALATGKLTSFIKMKDRRDNITIDGNLDEWQKLKALTLTGDGGFVYGPALWSGVNDLSGSFYFATSKEHLYIAGNVIDNSLISFSDGKCDAVTFYLDMRPEAGNFFARTNDCTDGCFTVTINSLPRANLQMNVAAAYEIAGQQSATGHSFEARIPLEAFGKWHSKDSKRIGLGIEIIDYDVADNPGMVKSLGFLLPTREPLGPVDPSLFGVAEF